jgi:hypothetical protein
MGGRAISEQNYLSPSHLLKQRKQEVQKVESSKAAARFVKQQGLW